MTSTACTFDRRDDALVAYLYDEADPGERRRFESHLASCGLCQADLAALRGVRENLAHWAPPEPVISHQSSVASRANPPSEIRHPQWWREIPAWAQVAAALLVLGVSASIANLNVHYGADGLTVRTGWSRTSLAEAATVSGAAKADAAKAEDVPTRADLAALEQQLRAEFHAAQVRTVASAAPSLSDAEVTRRVRALIDDSEKRQQRELALHIAEVMRDVNAQRRADLVRIDQNLGLVQNNTGIEIAKNRELLNYALRVSSQK